MADGNSNNPLQAIVNMYEESVAECDKAGYADKWKECSEIFFEEIAEQVSLFKYKPITFEDIEYLDGYFIFGMGTNSVVHFHIKECPGWLFAIWWGNPTENDNGTECVTGDFFTQYEETLDKFKPSMSEIAAKVSVYLNNKTKYCDYWKPIHLINFIRNEPYLAFCRDYNGWDYNYEYHTREEAELEFTKWREHVTKEAKYNKILDTKVLSFVRENIMPVFNGAEIFDNGHDVYPRYELIAPLNENKDIVSEPGCYSWFADDDEDGKRALDEFEAVIEECNEISREQDIYWCCPINSNIIMYEKKND